MRKPQKTLIFGLTFIFLSAAVVYAGATIINTPKDLAYVKDIDLSRYTGTWYAVREIPTKLGVWPFEYDSRTFTKETAFYSLNGDGSIKVVNSAIIKGELNTVEGKARQIDGGKLEVSFYGPFYAPYQIIGLDSDYEWAIVGSPNGNNLWYLSRSPTLEASVLAEMDAIAAANGFDVGRLVSVVQG